MASPKPRRLKTRGRVENLTNAGKGRLKGVPNKVTQEVKAFCFKLVSDQTYQTNFQAAFRARTLEAQLELMVWSYAFGKPPQALDVSLSFDLAVHLASLTPDD